jgi:outer membrane lipoprotein
MILTALPDRNGKRVREPSEAAMLDKTKPLFPALLLLVLGLWFAGCAPAFPPQITDKVDRHVSFKELQADPEKFKGVWLMLGGVIVSSRNAKEGTYLEILQKPLESDGRPEDTDATEGRFLVQTGEYLDSAVYHPGRIITIVGEVAGQKSMPLDETMYQFPLLTAKALNLWKPSNGPHFFFGVSVFHRI